VQQLHLPDGMRLAPGVEVMPAEVMPVEAMPAEVMPAAPPGYP